MLTFYFFGPALERTIGTPSLIVLYFVALVLSHLRTFVQQRNNPRYASLGASGAVSAVLFAAIVYFPNQSLFILPIPVPIPAPLFAIGYLAYSFGSMSHDTAVAIADASTAGKISLSASTPRSTSYITRIPSTQ